MQSEQTSEKTTEPSEGRGWRLFWGLFFGLFSTVAAFLLIALLRMLLRGDLVSTEVAQHLADRIWAEIVILFGAQSAGGAQLPSLLLAVLPLLGLGTVDFLDRVSSPIVHDDTQDCVACAEPEKHTQSLIKTDWFIMGSVVAGLAFWILILYFLVQLSTPVASGWDSVASLLVAGICLSIFYFSGELFPQQTQIRERDLRSLKRRFEYRRLLIEKIKLHQTELPLTLWRSFFRHVRLTIFIAFSSSIAAVYLPLASGPRKKEETAVLALYILILVWISCITALSFSGEGYSAASAILGSLLPGVAGLSIFALVLFEIGIFGNISRAHTISLIISWLLLFLLIVLWQRGARGRGPLWRLGPWAVLHFTKKARKEMGITPPPNSALLLEEETFVQSNTGEFPSPKHCGVIPVKNPDINKPQQTVVLSYWDELRPWIGESKIDAEENSTGRLGPFITEGTPVFLSPKDPNVFWEPSCLTGNSRSNLRTKKVVIQSGERTRVVNMNMTDREQTISSSAPNKTSSKF